MRVINNLSFDYAQKDNSHNILHKRILSFLTLLYFLGMYKEIPIRYLVRKNDRQSESSNSQYR